MENATRAVSKAYLLLVYCIVPFYIWSIIKLNEIFYTKYTNVINCIDNLESSAFERVIAYSDLLL